MLPFVLIIIILRGIMNKAMKKPTYAFANTIRVTTKLKEFLWLSAVI